MRLPELEGLQVVRVGIGIVVGKSIVRFHGGSLIQSRGRHLTLSYEAVHKMWI